MRALAVFDLDGTLTRHDTLLPYLAGFLARRPGRWWRVPLVLPGVLRFALLDRDRGRLKAALLRALLGGATRAEIEAWSAAYAGAVARRQLCPGAVRRLEAHRAAGDYLVLLSASPDLYVPAIARELGFDEAICTGVRWVGERLEGSLATENRRGEEKLRCIEALRARHPRLECAAYGNSRSDLPHLRRVERGMLVNAGAGARRAAAALAIPQENWRQ